MNMKKILLSTLVLVLTLGANAQTRNIDLSVESFIEPQQITSNTTQGTVVSLVAVLQNNSSTDTVKVGDTLIFQSTIRTLQGQTFVATNLLFRLVDRPIEPGDTQHFRLGYTANRYLINSQRVNLTLVVFLTNQPNLPLDNGTNNALAEEMDYINPNGFGVGVETVNTDQAKVYPNPANVNTVNITLNSAEVGASTTIRIFDLSGKLVKEINAADKKTVNIDISDLKNGIYSLQTINGSTKTVNKLTIAK